MKAAIMTVLVIQKAQVIMIFVTAKVNAEVVMNDIMLWMAMGEIVQERDGGVCCDDVEGDGSGGDGGCDRGNGLYEKD